MRIHVSLDSALSRFTEKSEFEIDALTVRGAIQAIDKQYPGFSSHVMDAGGFLGFIRVDLNNTFVERLDTQLSEGARLSFMMASRGG